MIEGAGGEGERKLNPQFRYLRIEIGQLLRELGTTAVYVTHDQDEAMALGDRIAVMQAGRIAQLGTPQEIYHQPANAFVADFIGAVNCLEVIGMQADIKYLKNQREIV